MSAVVAGVELMYKAKTGSFSALWRLVCKSVRFHEHRECLRVWMSEGGWCLVWSFCHILRDLIGKVPTCGINAISESLTISCVQDAESLVDSENTSGPLCLSTTLSALDKTEMVATASGNFMFRADWGIKESLQAKVDLWRHCKSLSWFYPESFSTRVRPLRGCRLMGDFACFYYVK